MDYSNAIDLGSSSDEYEEINLGSSSDEYEDAEEEADGESNPAGLLESKTTVTVATSPPQAPARFYRGEPRGDQVDGNSRHDETSDAYISSDSADGDSDDDSRSTTSGDGWSTSSDVETAPDYEDGVCELCRGPDLYANLREYCGCSLGRYHATCIQDANTLCMFWKPGNQARCLSCQGFTRPGFPIPIKPNLRESALRQRWQGKWISNIDLEPDLDAFLTNCGAQLDDTQAAHILEESYKTAYRAQRMLYVRADAADHKEIMASCWEVPRFPPDPAARVRLQAEGGHDISAPSAKPEVVAGVGPGPSRKQQRRARRQPEQPPCGPRDHRAAPLISDTNFWSCLEFDDSTEESNSRDPRGQRVYRPAPESGSRDPQDHRTTGAASTAVHRDASNNPPRKQATLEPPIRADTTSTLARCQCNEPAGGQTPVELPTSGKAEVEPAEPMAKPAAARKVVAREGQTDAERAHHLGTLHDKLYAKLHTKANSASGALPPGMANAPPPWACRKPKPAIAVDATLQRPRAGRHATTTVSPNASAAPGSKTAPETATPGWLDFLPKFSPRDHDPDLASWWLPWLLLGVGTAMLHPIADTGASMRALGYASLFGAASLVLKAAAFNIRQSARWVAREGAAFICQNAIPAPEPPAAPASYLNSFGELGPKEFREYILPWLIWPTCAGGIWHPSTPGKVKARREHLPCYCPTSSFPLSRSQAKRRAKALPVTPPVRTLPRPLSKNDAFQEAREEARVLHFSRHPIGPLVLGNSSRHARRRRHGLDTSWCLMTSKRKPRPATPARPVRHRHPDRKPSGNAASCDKGPSAVLHMRRFPHLGPLPTATCFGASTRSPIRGHD